MKTTPSGRPSKVIPGRTLVQRLIIHRADIMPIVKSVSAQKRKGAPTHVDYQDIVGAAFLGVADARVKFKKSKKVAFATYATTRSTGAVKDFIRREHAYAKRYVVSDFLGCELTSVVPSSEVHFCRRDLYEVVCRVLSELPLDQMSAVVGLYLEETPEKDLAKNMSLTVGALRRLIRAALETVRSRMLANNPGRLRAWTED